MNTITHNKGYNSYERWQAENQPINSKPNYLQNSMSYSNYAHKNDAEIQRSSDLNKMKQMIRGNNNSMKNSSSIIDSIHSYGESIRNNRANSKNTTSALKQLKYSCKAISSQIIRSKTARDCKQVASKARREVVSLKLKLQNGQYDETELQAAIVHAESMERVAKKKAHHLEQEELVKVTGSFSPSIEERIEENPELSEEDKAAKYEEFKTEILDQLSQADFVKDMTEEQLNEIMEMTEDFLDEMNEAMEEITDSFDELVDFLDSFESEMDPEDYQLLKIKHRTSEAKDMAKADAEYLKSMFQHYQEGLGTSGVTGLQSTFSPTETISSAINYCI